MGTPFARPTGAEVGRVHELVDGVERYIEHLVDGTPHRLDGLTVVVDCANGAASEVGPAAYERAGAEVIAIHAEPDGLNINDGCGSTHLEAVRAAVARARRRPGHRARRRRRPLPRGRRRRRGGRRRPDHGDPRARPCTRPARSPSDTLVATVMSNLGLRLAMQARRDPAGRDHGRRPVRAGGAARRRVRARRRAERARGDAGARHHRRRRADRAAPAGPDGRDRQDARRAGRRGAPAAAGADQRTGGRPGRPRPRPPTWPRRCRAADVRAGRVPAGSCCARPVPSSWSGSWSRRRPRRLAGAVAERIATMVGRRARPDRAGRRACYLQFLADYAQTG